MKSRELLSIVLSLIMILGVSAGSVYAQTDDVDDNSMDNDGIDDTTVKDDLDDDKVEDEIDATTTDDKLEYDRDEYDRDYVKDGRHYNLDERLGYFCDMTNDEKRQFFEDHPRFEQFSERLANYCNLSGDERDDKIRDFVRDNVRDEDRDRNVDKDMRHKLNRYCELSDEDKRKYIAKHEKTAEKAAKMDRFCALNQETDRADFIAENRDEYRNYMKDKMHDKMTDKKHMDYDRLCSMANSDRALEITDVAKLEKISEWCNMTPEEQEEFKMKHRDVMTDKMDKVQGKHLDYNRLCALSESDRALDIDDSKKLDRISNWCNMTIEEREEFKKEHHDIMKEKRQDAVNRIQENPNIPQRIKAMIMEKRDIVDDKLDEIRMKYEEKHGDLEDKKTKLKDKFKDHMALMKIEMSEERKSAIKDRVAEMKAFKIELRERSSELTDKEKQGLRAEFIETAKDIRLSWVSPRHQMNAGIDATEIECREGFSLVLKESNGRAMCLKADTALKMFDRGIAVPAI